MKQSWPAYTIVASVFMMLISGSLLTTGMFMDGLIYGNVADNMASGVCTFWHPTHSPSLHADFYEHPPLAMGLLAVFYKLFGTHIWVTRLFTMVTTVLTAWLTVRLWHRMDYDRRTGWLPLLLWVLIPAMSRNAHDNMLECTMVIFVLAAVLSLLPREGGKRLWNSALGGVFLFLAFLCKGFTGLYPFALPMIVWAVDWAMGQHTHVGRALLRALSDTLMAVGTFALCFAATGLLFPEAVTYFETYLSNQVLGNLDTPIVDNRWTIVKKFFEQTIILWALAIVVVGVVKAKSHKRVSRADRRVFWICFLLVLSGVLPIAISLKQRGFYILTVYPILAVGIGAIMQEPLTRWTSTENKKRRNTLIAVAVLAAMGAVALNAVNCGKPGRDVALQEDMRTIAPLLKEGEQVGIPPAMSQEWSLYAYYYREKHIDLKTTDLAQIQQPLPQHLLTDGSVDIPADLYAETPLPTQQYKLYVLKK